MYGDFTLIMLLKNKAIYFKLDILNNYMKGIPNSKGLVCRAELDKDALASEDRTEMDYNLQDSVVCI